MEYLKLIYMQAGTDGRAAYGVGPRLLDHGLESRWDMDVRLLCLLCVV
jgi:hypothetical protein